MIHPIKLAFQYGGEASLDPSGAIEIMPRISKKALTKRLSKVKLLLCDVDGVLTDGAIYIGADAEIKRFSIHDGLGLTLLRRHGVKVGWVSARPSPATTLRAEELKIDFLHQDRTSKVAAIEAILAQAGMTWTEVCYVGDDVVDLGALKLAGVAVSPSNGIAEVRQLAHHVTGVAGGHGAVREVVEMILKAQGKWAGLIGDCLA